MTPLPHAFLSIAFVHATEHGSMHAGGTSLSESWAFDDSRAALKLAPGFCFTQTPLSLQLALIAAWFCSLKYLSLGPRHRR